MKDIKRILSEILILFLLSAPAPAACADLYAFSSDTDRVLDSFAAEYAWSREKIASAEWTGADGIRYFRAAGHQKEYYEDLFRECKEYCTEHNLIKVASEGGAGGFNIAAVARAEVDAPDSMETPAGSNRTKYNDWFYSRTAVEAPWCAVFVSWCADRCGLISSGLYRKDAGVRTTYSYMTKDNGFASYSWREVKQMGGGAYSAVPGDLFFFEGMGHIGIVTNVSDTSIEVTHGNSSENNVMASLMSADGYMNHGTIVHVEYPSDEKAIFYFLTEHMGMEASAACGVIANIEYESNFNPNALGDGGTSYGICQWHNPSRWDQLIAFCDLNGLDWETMDGQLYYLEYEITQGGESNTGIYNALMSQPDTGQGAYQAGYEWCVRFERPDDAESKGISRGTSARDKWYPVFADSRNRGQALYG